MKKINVALCSYGMSGKVFHAPLIVAESQMQLTTVLQRANNSVSKDFPHINIAKNFDELLQDPTLDLIVVNTPNEFHYPMTKAALLAGKHVVCEKPFVIDLDEGKELIEIAKQQNKILAVFHNKRLEPDHLSVQQILQEKILGRVIEVEWHYDRFRTHITHKAWKENNLPGAGTWFDLGVHMVDSVLCLLGKPQAITADMRSLRDAKGATDYFNVICHYPDMRAILRSNTFVSAKGATVSVHGDKGSFLKFGQDQQEAQLQNGIYPGHVEWAKLQPDNVGTLVTQTEQGAHRETRIPPKGCYEHFYRNIANAILDKEPLQFGAQQALLAVEILLAAEESHHLKKTVFLE